MNINTNNIINNNNNSNNNNDNNSRIEKLFKTIFKNKLLVKLIFHFIHTVKWIKYYKYTKINAFNRIKFKDIQSLHFIIDNQLFTLLKCKLEADEPIISDTNSVNKLITLYSNGLVKSKLIEINFSKLFQLLLNNSIKYNKSSVNKLHIPSILKNAISLKLDNIVSIIVNGEYINSLESILIDNALTYNTPNIVEVLINSPIINISNETKETSLFKASINNHYFEEMINLVLNNTKLYQQQQTINNNNNVNLSSFFKIKSTQLQFKLIELNHVNLPNDILIKMKSEYQLDQSKGDEIIKKCNKFIFENYKDNIELYKHYLWKYKEAIYNINDIGGANGSGSEYLFQNLIYVFSNLNFEIFSNLLSNSLKLPILDGEYLNAVKSVITEPKVIETYLKSNYFHQFIKLYYSKINTHFKNNHFEFIVKHHLLVQNANNYEELVSSCEIQHVYPSRYNGVLISILNIDTTQNGNTSICYINVGDKGTIDWFEEYSSNCECLKSLKNDKFEFQFESVELIEYAKVKLKKESHGLIINHCFNSPKKKKNKRSRQYGYVFINAINRCNIDELNVIHNEISSNRYLKMQFNGGVLEFASGPLNISNQTNDNLLKVTSFINSIDADYMKQFINQHLQEFISIILDNTNADLKSISNTFIKYRNEFNTALVGVFLDSIYNSNYNLINPLKARKIMQQFNPIVNDPTAFFKYSSNMKTDIVPLFDYIQISDKYRFHYVIGLSVESTIECIKILVDQHGIISFNNSNLTQSNRDKSIHILQGLIRYLFKLFISIKETTKHQLLEVYNLIEENKVSNLEHTSDSEHYTVHYLRIRSVKFEKYFNDLPFIPKSRNSLTEIFRKWRKGLSFNSIFNSKFSQVLKLVIILFESHSNDTFSTFIDSTLSFLLDVKEFGLFFEQLESLKLKLQDSHFRKGSFPEEMIQFDNGSIIENSNGSNSENSNSSGGSSGSSDIADIDSNKQHNPKKRSINFKVNGGLQKLIRIDGTREYYFSEKVFEKACKVLDTDSFNRFIKFGNSNQGESIRKCILNEKNINLLQKKLN